MNSKEALNELKNKISLEKHINSIHNANVRKCYETVKQDLDRLEILEQKETPMKPNCIELVKIREYYDKDSFGYVQNIVGDCPKCGKELNENYLYCSKCGQKLNWGDL